VPRQGVAEGNLHSLAPAGCEMADVSGGGEPSRRWRSARNAAEGGVKRRRRLERRGRLPPLNIDERQETDMSNENGGMDFTPAGRHD